MHVRAEAEFPADPDAVARMMADEDFVRAKVDAAGARSHTLSVVGDASGPFTVTTRRQMPSDAIPAQFRSLVGDALEVRMVEAWESPEPDGRRGTVLVEVTGAPVRMTGTATLLRDPAGSRLVVEGELKAAIPLFGAAVERATASAVQAAAEAEERTGRQWLADHGT
ncbi:DUF2505 domain-containing protein [Actinotalea sp. M2MS4P-6]|uniref:DUF2505 domain-containing protein n=1 Tax=Actinotalea sp. M2MS4P-6 TaxID=2983762 RepID=UPI0021E3EB78|nr:DUF2505 domain-containing protein [Actinotalea sp. M2MS4P-6]MCV2395852.1 DUF2505 domain-containing protein [Actinotalea sp. M2MS4P-6]